MDAGPEPTYVEKLRVPPPPPPGDKPCGPRLSGYNLFAIMMVFLKVFFKVYLPKSAYLKKNRQNYIACTSEECANMGDVANEERTY